MSFAFGFTEEESSDNEIAYTQERTTGEEGISLAIDQDPLYDKENEPKSWKLEEILTSLLGSRISFKPYFTPGGHNVVYRREMFDIRHQVMMEDEAIKDKRVAKVLLDDSDSNLDLQSGIYEGGFKTWEGANDLVDEFQRRIDDGRFWFQNILELGCGTAIPTCFLLKDKFEKNNRDEVVFTVTDFNYDVFRLATVPNLIINWALTLPPEKLTALTQGEDNPVVQNDELLLTHALLEGFKNQLSYFNITLKFISGPWGRQFLNLLSQDAIDLVISAETIYSPNSQLLVSEIILHILSASSSKIPLALVAAKNMYFGVGGSVVDFVSYLHKIKSDSITVFINDVPGSQLKRKIIAVESNL